MSTEKIFLHSHSALERNLHLPKHIVLVDEGYGHMFTTAKKFSYNKNVYYKVSIAEFVSLGGTFKNLKE